MPKDGGGKPEEIYVLKTNFKKLFSGLRNGQLRRMLLTKQAEELDHIWSIVVVRDDLISVISVAGGVSQMEFIHWTMVRPIIPSAPF